MSLFLYQNKIFSFCNNEITQKLCQNSKECREPLLSYLNCYTQQFRRIISTKSFPFMLNTTHLSVFDVQFVTVIIVLFWLKLSMLMTIYGTSIFNKSNPYILIFSHQRFSLKAKSCAWRSERKKIYTLTHTIAQNHMTCASLTCVLV